MSKFDWGTKQADRFQNYLNNCGMELTDEQLTETLEDFREFEDQDGEMSFDTFMERLRIRVN